tara:strand:+ start:3757 stop:4818 length:1062 start_codon:yes stop_codon:yes gene_type:complete
MKIKNKFISLNKPTYFIADIAANHDGDLNRAKDLIYKVAELGANAAKFQHFEAATIVSDIGFKNLKKIKTHQSKWKKSVYQVYRDASLDFSWTEELKKTADNAGIDFFTSPYSIELVNKVDKYVSAFKVGSGDITWHEIILAMASKKKPLIIATGASSFKEINLVVNKLKKNNYNNFALLQCNTNYTGSLDNFNFINLNVLNLFKKKFPNIIYGLSDHTPGHSTVLGAISLGARIIEKHFTDDNSRNGPDHLFSMNPLSWKEMISRSRELESSMGKEIKKVEMNEKNSIIVQRRSIRVNRNLKKGEIINQQDLICLRPCPNYAIPPYEIKKVIGKKLNKNILKGECLSWKILK